MRRSGFTLVELAIVLVIIGLLIAGVLVAQSMIQTAKIADFVKQTQQYDIAVSNFYFNYKQLPGDSSYFSPAGNNNGQIISDTLGNGRLGGEIGNFWKHLYDGKMIDTSYSNSASSGVVVGVHTPIIKIGVLGKIGIVAEYNDGSNGEIDAGYNNFIFGYFENTGSPTYGWNSATARPALLAQTAFAIDKKMDDGLPWTGNVKGINGGFAGITAPLGGVMGGPPPYINAGQWATVQCATAAASTSPYRVAETIGSCGLSIRLMSLTSKEFQ